MRCPRCHQANEETNKFCGNCGAKLGETGIFYEGAVPSSPTFCGESAVEFASPPRPEARKEEIASERKYVTVLFADISGYTSLAEQLDPEEIKDLASHVLSEIAKVVIKYGGYLEKFAGDQVMALFGVPLAHEDDPVRAVKTASEIHDAVRRISPEVHKIIGKSLAAPLAMHIGINTGLAATGKFHLVKEAPQIAGDIVNVASRLCTLAQAGETLVGQTTYSQAEPFFSFDPLKPVRVKGKAQPVQIYRVLAARELPDRRSRKSMRQAPLVGRHREMTVLMQAMARLKEGKGSVIAICGEAGTGKSRLLDELKASLDLTKIKWLEGHAYAYTQNIPYYPLINLIKRDLAIAQGDTPGMVAAKLEAKLRELGVKEDVAPYIGGLLSLHFPEAAEMSPEFWKIRLQRTLSSMLQAQAKLGPVVICFEDLQWADPTFLNFLRRLITELDPIIVFLYTCRRGFRLFTQEEVKRIGEPYRQIPLHDLSPAEIQDMVTSLLQPETAPEELRRYIREKVGSNPFYVQEIINSFIESGVLQVYGDHWRLTGAIGEYNIPPTIHAVIAERVDHLTEAAKHLLQEASALGRTVSYEILKRITRYADNLDPLLKELEDHGLLRRASQPEREYLFKHSLIQEVVYSGLLKRERQALHQRIGLLMEQAFSNRLPEFYENLAYHFQHSELSPKAVDYLRKSGRKSLKNYAVQESHQYYLKAFQILSRTSGDSDKEKRRLIDLLNEWGRVFYYRADFAGFSRLFHEYQALAESISDKTLLGVFYGWLCIILFCTGKVKESHEFTLKALALGRETDCYTAMGLAYANLTWTCAELNLLDQGLQYAEEIMVKEERYDPMFYLLALGGLAMIYLFKGDTAKNLELGKVLIDFGERLSDRRSILVGCICISYAHYTAGDLSGAVEWDKKAVGLSNDPLFVVWPELVLANYYLQSNQFQEADEILQRIIPVCQTLGMDYIATFAQALQGAVLMGKGQLSRGLAMIKAGLRKLRDNGRLISVYLTKIGLAEVYFQIATRTRPLGIGAALKNWKFILKEVPFAHRKAQAYLAEVIQTGKEIGAGGFMHGHAWFQLGLLYQHRGDQEQAQACFDEAQKIFARCSTPELLQQVREPWEPRV